MSQKNSFRYFQSSPEIIRLAVMLYVRFPLSLRNVEDLLNKLGIDVSYEAVRYWWNRFGPMFAAETRRKRIQLFRIGSRISRQTETGSNLSDSTLFKFGVGHY